MPPLNQPRPDSGIPYESASRASGIKQIGREARNLAQGETQQERPSWAVDLTRSARTWAMTPVCAIRPFTGPVWKGMSGRRPVVKGLVELCERFGCGHVFGLLAREMNVLLALMLVRMALRPISKTRSLWRLPFSPGFRAVPLVHIASPSPSMRIALRRNLVPAELVGSGGDRTVVVMAAFGRERIDDPRQLVGERHRG
jgi:hypothetical protein